MRPKLLPLHLAALLLASPGAAFAAERAMSFKFDFGAGPVAPGYTQVTASDVYSKERGWGFSEGAAIVATQGATPDALRGDACVSDQPFLFHADLPEGNYRVAVTLGDAAAESDTTVKAESRRLMLEQVQTAPGKFESRTFTVNVRGPEIAGGGRVSLNGRESGPPIAAHWDDRLTLEFNGPRPAVCALEIAAVNDALTVYLAGDSTVTDQTHEPYAAWGQMLTRFFQPDVAVANHAESGLALSSFTGQKRLEKVLSTLKPGDYVLIQFGHNDQKDKASGAGPFTTYKTRLKSFIAAVREKGGTPVLVTPMERRRWDAEGKQFGTLADYAEAVRQAATEDGAPVIDLNAMSLRLYKALGPEGSKKALVHFPAGSVPGQARALADDTHHSPYGAYELAKCVVEGIKAQVPALAKRLLQDIPPFSPDVPDPIESFKIPTSPGVAREKPAGS